MQLFCYGFNGLGFNSDKNFTGQMHKSKKKKSGPGDIFCWTAVILIWSIKTCLIKSLIDNLEVFLFIKEITVKCDLEQEITWMRSHCQSK